MKVKNSFRENEEAHVVCFSMRVSLSKRPLFLRVSTACACVGGGGGGDT